MDDLDRGGRGPLDLERIAFFSDAVLAIALTVLAIELTVPTERVDELNGALLAMAPKFASFLLSFLAIAAHWRAHHRMFRLLGGWDRRLIGLNTLFLLLVVFLPFPTALLGTFLDELPPAVTVLYSATLCLITATRAATWWYARRAGLLLPDVTLRLRREVQGATLPATAGFALAVPLAFVVPRYAWLPWVLWPVPVWLARLTRSARRATPAVGHR